VVITEVPPEAQSVIKKLADARLLVTGQETKIETDTAQDEPDAKS